MSQFIGRALTVMALFMVTGFQASDAAEQLIKEFVDLIQERGTAEWVDAYGRPVGLEGPDSDRNILQMRPIYDPEAAARGDEPSLGLYMEAKPAPGDMEFGLEGQFTVQLPAQRFYQFQGFAHVQNGEARETNVKVLVQTRPDLLSDWTTAQIFTGEKLGTKAINDELKEDILAFVLDLSDWAGDEVRIVLAMNVVPAYSKVGPEESWSPNVISAQWTSARIVGSAFRVILGEPEKVDNSIDGLSSRDDIIVSNSVIQGITSFIGSEERILIGHDESKNGDWNMYNPGESSINTIFLPSISGLQGHFVAYTTTRLSPLTLGGSEPYPRLIDFRNSPSTNLSNASSVQIKNNVYRDSNNIPINVITRGEPYPYNDEFAGHVAIASLMVGNINGTNTPILHTFIHTEDMYKDDININNPRHPYNRIGYARSIGNSLDFGRTFDKLNHQDGNSIITYELDEEDIVWGGGMYGCGDPTVIERDGYYYMIFTTRSLIKYPPGHPLEGEIWPSATGSYRPRAVFSIARTPASTINKSNIDYANETTSPWKKFKEVDKVNPFNSLNWQEPGIRGKFSALWNVITDSDGLRTDQILDNSKERFFPKVSRNTYLSQSVYGNRQYVLICKGELDNNIQGILIHTSNDLVNWSDPIFLLLDEPTKGPGEGFYFTYEYPNLVGVSDYTIPDFTPGYNNITGKINMLYYQKDKRAYNVTFVEPPDLCRRPLEFQYFQGP